MASVKLEQATRALRLGKKEGLDELSALVRVALDEFIERRSRPAQPSTTDPQVLEVLRKLVGDHARDFADLRTQLAADRAHVLARLDRLEASPPPLPPTAPALRTSPAPAPARPLTVKAPEVRREIPRKSRPAAVRESSSQDARDVEILVALEGRHRERHYNVREDTEWVASRFKSRVDWRKAHQIADGYARSHASVEDQGKLEDVLAT